MLPAVALEHPLRKHLKDVVSNAMVGSELIYHELQKAARCGEHALNNLWQGPRWSSQELMSIAQELQAKSGWVHAASAGWYQIDVWKRHSIPGGPRQSDGGRVNYLRSSLKKGWAHSGWTAVGTIG